jgi:hypothetical protein
VGERGGHGLKGGDERHGYSCLESFAEGLDCDANDVSIGAGGRGVGRVLQEVVHIDPACVLVRDDVPHGYDDAEVLGCRRLPDAAKEALEQQGAQVLTAHGPHARSLRRAEEAVRLARANLAWRGLGWVWERVGEGLRRSGETQDDGDSKKSTHGAGAEGTPRKKDPRPWTLNPCMMTRVCKQAHTLHQAG